VPIYFFDTSALKHRYCHTQFRRRICRIVSDDRWPCYIAELTLLEMASAFAHYCRTAPADVNAYDGMDYQFLKDIADERVKVTAPRRAMIDRARLLLRYAGAVKRRNLRSADALIAVTCLELALEVGQRIIFYTRDKTLYSILHGLSAYRRALHLRYLD
jgi:hypothetical protein